MMADKDGDIAALNDQIQVKQAMKMNEIMLYIFLLFRRSIVAWDWSRKNWICWLSLKKGSLNSAKTSLLQPNKSRYALIHFMQIYRHMPSNL